MKTSLIICLILLNFKGLSQSTEHLPYFKGKNITAYVITSISYVLDSAAIGDYLDFKVDYYQAIDNDLKTWSNISGYQALLLDSSKDYKVYRVTKIKQSSSGKHLAMVVSGEGLKELKSSFDFAWVAALSGMEVDIYFHGSAAKLLEEGYKEYFRANKDAVKSNERKKYTKDEYETHKQKLSELENRGATFYVSPPSKSHHKVKESRVKFLNIEFIEYPSFLKKTEGADIKKNLKIWD
jgi:predicted peroxiredoxin